MIRVLKRHHLKARALAKAGWFMGGSGNFDLSIEDMAEIIAVLEHDKISVVAGVLKWLYEEHPKHKAIERSFQEEYMSY